ncbi:hypothetical protein [Bacillus sp. AFS088145]|uniref:hypothetical protein n=1 Tax=Bacillus sp. AFS088145 TaxID=2033514 RepID=UPI000BF392FF|nr:hypothetical protein [Bacillus sp. AFS088145]PFH83596.1 hypothetical protein COI44_17465 [Bacillus sp. AFS088145]
MVIINFYIGTTNEADSNEFLKCLWSEIAKEFGKCSWIYIPSKQYKKNRIFFGFMSIGVGEFEVSITYKVRGSIENIYFEIKEDTKVTNLKEVNRRLKKTINSTRDNIGKYKFFQFTTSIKSTLMPLAPYEGEKYYNRIDATSNYSHISVIVEAYDGNQGEGIAHRKINQILDFLAVETNAPFWECDGFEEKLELAYSEIYQEDEGFIDGFSSENGFLVISREGKNFIQKIVNLCNEEDESIDLFIKACNHFHTARKFQAQIENVYFGNVQNDENGATVELKTHDDLKLAANLGGSHKEISTTLYLSALEVITLIGFEDDRCKSCGQPKFKIKQRVKEIVTKYINENIAKQMSDFYDERSFYLHKGKMLTNHIPTKNSIPLLDKNDSRGCIHPVGVPLTNIMELTSFCLRKFYKENLL